MNRDAKILIITSGIGSIPWGFLSVIQPIYFSLINFDPAQIGLLFTISALTGALLSIPFGILADKFGRKIFLITGGFFSFFSFLIYLITIEFLWYIFSSFISGLSGAMYFSPFYALFADKTDDNKREKAFSYSAFLGSACFTIGALLSAIPDILQFEMGFSILNAYRPMFFLAGLLILISSLLIFIVGEEKVVKEKKAILPKKSKDIIIKFSITNALIGFGAGFIIPLFSLWFYLKFHLGGSFLGPLYAVSNVIMAIAYLIAPKLSSLMGTVRFIICTQICATVLLIFIPNISDILIVGLLYVLRNFLMNMSNPIQNAFSMSLIEQDERATASSVIGTAWSVPNSISPTFGGYLMRDVSLSIPFYICAVNYVLSITLFYAFFRNYSKKEEKSIEAEAH